MIPSYEGGKLPLTTNLARRVRAIVAEPGRWHALPEPVAEWLKLQRWRSELPERDGLLVETFPRHGKSPTPSKAATHTRRSACC